MRDEHEDILPYVPMKTSTPQEWLRRLHVKDEQEPKVDPFLRRRKTGIGGSDVAALLNMDPFRSSLDLWKDKTSEPEPTTGPEPWYFERGHMLEPVIRELYQRRTGDGVKLARFKRHKKYRFMLCHPDGIIQRPGVVDEGVLEIKHAALGVFAKIRREGIPYHWQLQMQHNLLVTGRPWGAFAVFNAERWQLLVVEVKADAQLQQTLVELERQWWESYVVPRTPPPIDHKHPVLVPPPQAEGIKTMDDAAWAAAVQDWFAASELETQVALLEEQAKATLQELMGERGVAEGGGARVYWKEQEGRERRDWKALVEAAPMDRLKVQEYLVRHNVPIPRGDQLTLDLSAFVSTGKSFDTFRVYPIQEQGNAEPGEAPTETGDPLPTE